MCSVGKSSESYQQSIADLIDERFPTIEESTATCFPCVVRESRKSWRIDMSSGVEVYSILLRWSRPAGLLRRLYDAVIIMLTQHEGNRSALDCEETMHQLFS